MTHIVDAAKGIEIEEEGNGRGGTRVLQEGVVEDQSGGVVHEAEQGHVVYSGLLNGVVGYYETPCMREEGQIHQRLAR